MNMEAAGRSLFCQARDDPAEQGQVPGLSRRLRHQRQQIPRTPLDIDDDVGFVERYADPVRLVAANEVTELVDSGRGLLRPSEAGKLPAEDQRQRTGPDVLPKHELADQLVLLLPDKEPLRAGVTTARGLGQMQAAELNSHGDLLRPPPFGSGPRALHGGSRRSASG